MIVERYRIYDPRDHSIRDVESSIVIPIEARVGETWDDHPDSYGLTDAGDGLYMVVGDPMLCDGLDPKQPDSWQHPVIYLHDADDDLVSEYWFTSGKMRRIS